MKKQKAGIVGAGIGGLATAIHLAANGYDVELFEQADKAGGKIGEIRHNGYRFDTGPSLFTLPELLEELYETAGTPPENRLKYLPLPHICKYLFADGAIINVPANPKAFASAAEEQLGEPASNITSYLTGAARLYDLAAEIFLFTPFQKLKYLFVKNNLPVGLRLHKLKAFTTLHKHNKRSFSKNNTIQIFDRYATYNGSSPYKAPATLKMIAHLEHNLGAFFPKGGMRSIVNSLKDEADRLGVRFHFNRKVEEIITEKRRVKGLKTSDGNFTCDHVVSNADIFHTYNNLLPGFSMPANLRKATLSSSAIIFYWCINRTYQDLELHNILFSEDYKAEFDSLGKNTCPFNDPSVYIYISSKANTSDAPEGGENWFVMINATPDEGQYVAEVISDVRQTVIRKINTILGIDIEPQIIHESTNTPSTLSDLTNSYKGALYGAASNSMWSAFLRHPNFSRRITNLWFAGGTVHPGGGIPLCLASARTVANLIQESNDKF